MVNAVRIDAPQAGFIMAIRQVSVNMYAAQANAMAIYNVPAPNINVTYGGENIVYTRIAQGMPTTQALVMAVVRGTIDNPKLTSWAYTLDGHDYFVLKLGTSAKTLVFDLSTGQWAWWSSLSTDHWRANTGMNWKSSGNIPFQYGSNVIVGDDSYGILWVLDPEKGTDDAILDTNVQSFPRVATGQVIARDRQFNPIFSVALTASLGEPALTPNTVTLRYSDDQGRTFVVADDVKSVTAGDYEQEFEWRSLGVVKAPGRLLQIEDDGAFARIDGLDVNFMQG